jgi:NADPH:quinone reductase-like Zn-dependent oxidoreductase
LRYRLAITLRIQNLAHAGFQLFTACSTIAAEPIYLGGPVPGQAASDASASKQSILIWGSSSVVGTAAIQLAAASGLIVISTASARSLEYLLSLGATYIFDYSDADVVSRILKAMEETTLVGAYDPISKPDTIAKSPRWCMRAAGESCSRRRVELRLRRRWWGV